MSENPLINNPPQGVSDNERSWATLIHLSALTGLVIPVLMVIAPLIIWFWKKKDKPFVDTQGKEAINFQLTILIGLIICIPLMFIIIGFVLALILVIIDLVCIVIAAMKTNEGVNYRYPFAFHFVR